MKIVAQDTLSFNIFLSSKSENIDNDHLYKLTLDMYNDKDAVLFHKSYQIELVSKFKVNILSHGFI